MVEEHSVQRAAVPGDARERAVGRVDSSVVRREERVAVEPFVECVKEGDIARLVRRAVIEAERRALEDRREAVQRQVVCRDCVLQVFGHLQHVPNDEDRQIAERGCVYDC